MRLNTYLICFLSGCFSNATLSKRYDDTITGLEEYLEEYTEDDYAYQGSLLTLEYLKGINLSDLKTSQITAVNQHDDSLVVYWVGESLAVKGVKISSQDQKLSVFIKIPSLYLPEFKKAEQEQIDFVAKFSLQENKELEDMRGCNLKM